MGFWNTLRKLLFWRWVWREFNGYDSRPHQNDMDSWTGADKLTDMNSDYDSYCDPLDYDRSDYGYGYDPYDDCGSSWHDDMLDDTFDDW